MTERTAPIEGERVIFCQHADVGEEHISLSAPFHWYFLGEGNETVKRDDGEEFIIRWVAICDGCRRSCKTASDVVRFAAQDAPWIGPPPEIARLI